MMGSDDFDFPLNLIHELEHEKNTEHDWPY